MKLDHLVFKASNLEDSAKFYGALLLQVGFTKVGEFHWQNAEEISIVLQQASADAAPYQRYSPGLNHFAFKVESDKEFDETLHQLAVSGISLPNVQSFASGRSIFIPDPDGLRLEIAFETLLK